MDLKDEIKELKEIYQLKLNKLCLTNERFFISGYGFDSSLKKKDIQIITTSKDTGKIEIFDKFGNKHTIKSSMTIGNIEKLFLNFPQFIRTHENYIVNINELDYFSPSETEKQGNTLSFKLTAFKAVLSASNSDKVKRYFNIKSLDPAKILYENSDKTANEVCKIFGFGRRTLFNYLSEKKKL